MLLECKKEVAEKDIKVKKMVEKIKGLMRTWNFNGHISFSYKSEMLLNEAYGMADFEKNMPFDDELGFFYGSITKQFLAISVMMLCEENMISMEDYISQYIPELKQGDKVKIKHLLSMCSGVIDYVGQIIEPSLINDGSMSEEEFLVYKLDVLYASISWEELLEMINDKELQFTPGEKKKYCNTNYILIQQIIERVTGISLEEFLETRIFKPFGIVNAKFGSYESDVNSYCLHKDKRYLLGKGRGNAGDGSIVMSQAEMMKYLSKVGKDPIISEESWKTMLSPNIDNYGMAWFKVGNWNYHGGTGLGYICQVYVNLIDDITISIIGNLGPESINGGFYEKIGYLITMLEVRALN